MGEIGVGEVFDVSVGDSTVLEQEFDIRVGGKELLTLKPLLVLRVLKYYKCFLMLR